MIRVSDGLPWGAGPSPAVQSASAWSVACPRELAFATLWATGGEPGRDRLLRVSALRSTSTERWESFEASCRVGAASAEAETLGARIAQDFGLHAADLAAASEPAAVLADLAAFLARRTVITAAREPLLVWLRSVGAPLDLRVLDLSEIAALCLPGRLAAEGEALAAELLGRTPERGLRALEPAHLRAALGVLAARVLARPEPARALLAHALSAAAACLAREGRERAEDVAVVLALLEHPSVWRDPARALEPESYELRDARLSSAAREHSELFAALEVARPRWTRAAGAPASAPPALRLEEERTLDAADLRAIDEIFEVHLPRAFAGEGESYRPGQHGVARVIAEGFGRRELRLIHAPTGTGKTLAYLVPVALWARRNNVRVGVATYTRVLQEQARERETPLALELLRQAAGASDIDVRVLKGRENYLCWRALCLQVPATEDASEEWLAWNALAQFALSDEDGDLDRFVARAPLGGQDSGSARAASERLVRATRSTTGCCAFAADRATCGADAALRAAERAHVVITNHALALARRDFFQHLVFDECEHLHDVALNAFSSSVGLRALESTLLRLGGDGRKPLERVRVLALDGSEAAAQATLAARAVLAAHAALADLATQCQAFKRWRAERVRERQEADQHSLFREYVERCGAALCTAHGALRAALAELASALAQLSEALDGALPSREAPRLRRALEILRLELEEQRGAVEAWIPRDERGSPSFGRESFHDLETSAADEDLLATRVLLPHEYLGRRYYPNLAGAVLLSATTWLRGGFDSASAYLGLARAAEPAPEEEREPMPLASFRAPEAFDYARVLVAVPRDAPPVGDKQAYLEYAARFIGYLAERTRGRLLALFTNAEDVAAIGARLEPFFAARGLPFWWQRMRGTTKEELGQLFRNQIDSTLLGLDAFWYGADFPGATLEYLVLARLPFGVPDRYHHAQCAALGAAEQRRTIYLPRALAKFRQGFGRLMRKESDKGCVFVLDKRILDPRQRAFLQELPLENAWEAELREAESEARRARLVLGESERCIDEALAHMGLKAEVRRRGLQRDFAAWTPEA
ncbi:MAG: hypothetical protein EXS08_11170 [Planctomycetes bacterium]|nr:hypothetical protein [Planctomycetota bacterium]